MRINSLDCIYYNFIDFFYVPFFQLSMTYAEEGQG